jgi:carboxyl-terminal processing protease
MRFKLSLRQVRTAVLVLLLMLASGGLGWKLGRKELVSGPITVNRSQPASKKEINLDMFWQVWDVLHERYLIKADLNPQEMVWGAIRGMTAALNDRYTVFLAPQQNKAVKEELNGAFEGVGIQLGFKDERLAVVAPLAGMPAEAVGVKAGDLILHLKDEAKGIDEDTVDMSLPEAVEIIRGPKGSKISLTILHEGEQEPITVEIVRDTIVIKSVELSFGSLSPEGKWQEGVEPKIAYLRLSRFGGRTEAEWNEAVQEILKQESDLNGLILDLRNNPGGYLEGAVYYAAEFLDRGTLVVKQEDSQGQVETYSVSRKGSLLSIPLVVLINQGSASSSEILAGALKDNQRAKLVGEKSFGKGTIQEALELGEGAGLHVTTAKWLLPSGAWVNDSKGLEPDVVIKDDEATKEVDEQLVKAGAVLEQ